MIPRLFHNKGREVGDSFLHSTVYQLCIRSAQPGIVPVNSSIQELHVYITLEVFRTSPTCHRWTCIKFAVQGSRWDAEHQNPVCELANHKSNVYSTRFSKVLGWFSPDLKRMNPTGKILITSRMIVWRDTFSFERSSSPQDSFINSKQTRSITLQFRSY